MTLDVFAFSDFQTPGNREKRKYLKDLVRIGLTHEEIRTAAKVHADRDFLAVFKLLANGHATPTQPAFKPSTRTKPKDPAKPDPREVRRRRDAAFQEAKEKLRSLPSDELSLFRVEAERRLGPEKLSGELLARFIESKVLTLVAEKYGIMGL